MSNRILEDNTWTADEILLPQTMGRSYYLKPEQRLQETDAEFADDSALWKEICTLDGRLAERIVKLNDFKLFEWVSRNPGLFHTSNAPYAREEAQSHILSSDPSLALERRPRGDEDPAQFFRDATSDTRAARRLIYAPQGKLSMLHGGVGCVRYSPVERVQGDVVWFMGATSGFAPDPGIPILVSNFQYQKIIDDIRRYGYLACTIVGRTKFIGKDTRDLYSIRTGIPRIYIDVLEITPRQILVDPAMVSVAASFISEFEGTTRIYASYVTFDPGQVGDRHAATRWLQEEYVEKMYKGFLFTDFDQQAPEISDTLFSLNDVLTSPSLAKKITQLREQFGHFDWSLLEEKGINFVDHQENLMVSSVIKGDGNQVSIVTGNESKAIINPAPSLHVGFLEGLLSVFGKFRRV
jgi:hypothetical protein